MKTTKPDPKIDEAVEAAADNGSTAEAIPMPESVAAQVEMNWIIRLARSATDGPALALDILQNDGPNIGLILSPSSARGIAKCLDRFASAAEAVGSPKEGSHGPR